MNESRVKSKANLPTCSLCHAIYDTYYHLPLVLPKCGHTFCQKCIQNKLITKGNRRVFTCDECRVDVMVRKSVSDELPRNIGILDVVKNMKKNFVEDGKKQCTEHQKPLEVICVTCNNLPICSHCAMFGEHKGHTIATSPPPTPTDLKDLQEYFGIVRQSVHSSLLPTSPNNILTQSKNTLTTTLKQTIKLLFQSYYEQIMKKQEQLMKQCEEVEVGGDVGITIDEALQDYELLKLKYEDCGLTSSGEVLDEVFEGGKQIHEKVEAIVQQAQLTVSQFVDRAVKRLNNTIFFRIQEVCTSSLKTILAANSNHHYYDMPQSRTSEHFNHTPMKTLSQHPKSIQKHQKEEKKIKDNKSIASYGRQKIQSKINISSASCRKTTSRHKSKPSNIENQQQNMKVSPEQLKYHKPTKEITYQHRNKLQDILNEIDRQSAGGMLELIGHNLNDQLVLYICQHLRAKKLQYSVMKLVKNGLTDEGMRILLSYLICDKFTKVLNVTGNALTSKSLQYLAQFVDYNPILKTIYLSNNKISPFQLKSRRKIFDQHAVQINL